jgi:hypothetical protein
VPAAIEATWAAGWLDPSRLSEEVEAAFAFLAKRGIVGVQRS